MDGQYTTTEVDKLIMQMARWEELEHDQWKLISFDEDKARFGWFDDSQFTKFVTVERRQISFFRGACPDALDQLE